MKPFNLIILLFAFGTNTYAQENEEDVFKNEFKIGFNAGGNYSDIYGEGSLAKDYKGTINYNLGLSAEYRLTKRWSLLANINYDRKFVKDYYPTSFFGTTPRDKAEFNFEYLSIPLMAKYRIPNTFLYGVGGMYYANLLEIKNYNNGVLSGIDFKEVFANEDFGLVAGFGFQFYENENETNALSIELRDSFGLKDISGPFFESVKTNSLCLLLNYNISL